MSQANDLERQMLELINTERANAGLAPVQLELRLNDSAEDHSQWMLDTDIFSHTGQGGSSAGDRMRDAGFEFSGSWTWAENIAWQSVRGAPGYEDDVIDLHTSLMNSPGHRANILNPTVTVIGIGIELGDMNGWDAIIVTQNFARTSAPLQLDTGTPTPPGGQIVPAGTAGTSGDDWLILEDGAAGRLRGLAGDDQLEGSDAQNTLLGNNGDDTLLGRGGNDTLAGGRGQDRLEGDAGRDTLRGGADDDTLMGGADNDTLLGQNGNDTLLGGAGQDSLTGGRGTNILTGGADADLFVFTKGTQIVTDFETIDQVDLSKAHRITDFADLTANHLTQNGDDAVIDDGRGNQIILENTQASTLVADDFLF